MKNILLCLLLCAPLSMVAQNDTIFNIEGSALVVPNCCPTPVTLAGYGGNSTGAVSMVSSGVTVSTVSNDVEVLYTFIKKNGGLTTEFKDAMESPICIKWYSSDWHTLIWIENLKMTNEDFEKLATHIRGDETQILANCNSYEIGAKGEKRAFSIDLSFADKNGYFPSGHRATYANLQKVKKIVKSYFASSQGHPIAILDDETDLDSLDKSCCELSKALNELLEAQKGLIQAQKERREAQDAQIKQLYAEIAAKDKLEKALIEENKKLKSKN